MAETPAADTVAFRSFDGTGNNLSRPDLNSAGTAFARVGDARFVDSVSAMVDGPNPRTISNLVVGQGDPLVTDPRGLSSMMAVWGQFIDHDLDFNRGDGVTTIDVEVPPGDPFMPDGSFIPLTRGVIDPNTGAGTDQPAAAINSITGWLDASMVYGSSAQTAAGLRLPDGRMNTSEGGNLPLNANGRFAAGDTRAAENPDLTALQVLFVREHNWQVDRLREENPELTGDQLYDLARAIVTAEIQNITYSEYLPHLVGNRAIDAYKGYDPSVDPRITSEFAGAAFRFGHSIVPDQANGLAEDGTIATELALKDAFGMTPQQFTEAGAEGFLRDLASTPSPALDARIVDGLRNFLTDGPARIDLAATNLQRGRDFGLGTLNDTREALGLERHETFRDMTGDRATAAALREAYGSVDAVELWVGGLAERHAGGAMVGETFQALISQQFENLRDGDRFWFERQGFDADTLAAIRDTSLGDIMDRAMDIRDIQDDVFVAVERRAAGVQASNPEGPQLVVGTADGPALVGGRRADILVAGEGQQVMTGGRGADEFRFHEGATNARITDFRPGVDTLRFDAGPEGGQDFGDVRIRGNGRGDAVVRLGDDRIVLVGVHPDRLSEKDFVFGEA